MATDNQPPVEAIQGEARAREVLIQSGMHEDADRATGLVPYAIAIRAMLAFQSEARAVPSGGELRDMPADDEIRLLREALTIYGDRVRMARSARPDLQQVIDYAFEHTPNRPAFGGDSETRHLPHQADREAIARVIDPMAWGVHEKQMRYVAQISDPEARRWRQDIADSAVKSSLAKADAILALSSSLAPEGGEGMSKAWCEKMAHAEGDVEIGAGLVAMDPELCDESNLDRTLGYAHGFVDGRDRKPFRGSSPEYEDGFFAGVLKRPPASCPTNEGDPA